MAWYFPPLLGVFCWVFCWDGCVVIQRVRFIGVLLFGSTCYAEFHCGFCTIYTGRGVREEGVYWGYFFSKFSGSLSFWSLWYFGGDLWVVFYRAGYQNFSLV